MYTWWRRSTPFSFRVSELSFKSHPKMRTRKPPPRSPSVKAPHQPCAIRNVSLNTAQMRVGGPYCGLTCHKHHPPPTYIPLQTIHVNPTLLYCRVFILKASDAPSHTLVVCNFLGARPRTETPGQWLHCSCCMRMWGNDPHNPYRYPRVRNPVARV